MFIRRGYYNIVPSFSWPDFFPPDFLIFLDNNMNFSSRHPTRLHFPVQNFVLFLQGKILHSVHSTTTPPPTGQLHHLLRPPPQKYTRRAFRIGRIPRTYCLFYFRSGSVGICMTVVDSKREFSLFFSDFPAFNLFFAF